jgi:hypothetical protein
LICRYAETTSGEPAEYAAGGFVPYPTSWLAAGRRLLAPFGREPAAGEFVGAYADMLATNAVPKWLRLTGKRTPATHNALAIETEPPQVSRRPVAQIQWHRTTSPCSH